MTLVDEFRKYWLIAIIGCVLFLLGIGVLFWNEGRAVRTILSLDEALDAAITVNPDEELDSLYEGRIVHIVGPIVMGEPLTEPEYNIQVLAVKLKRRVQMYQWVEETIEHNFGESIASIQADDRTYYYTKEWKDKLVDSRNFYIRNGHHNPEKFPIESQIQVTENVYIGKYELGKEVKNRFNNFIELTSDTRPEEPSIKLHLGLYYHTNDVFSPEVGDLRILFSFCGLEGEMHTIVGKLEKGKIVPYQTSRKLKILLAYPGELSLHEVFRREHHTQKLQTWTFRLMGWILLFFAATCTTSLLNYMLSRICFLSSLAPDPSYPIKKNLILSFSMALIITSIAWVLHRPWVGATLLLAAASPFLYCAKSVIGYQRVN